MKAFYTTGEVAKLIGIAPKTVINYCDQGKIQCDVTPITGYRRIPRQSLLAFMEQYGLDTALLNGNGDDKNQGPARVLIMDDNAQIVTLLTELLKEIDPAVQLEDAPDGYQGCLKVGTFRPDLILLDIVMPGTDGFEVCKTLRASSDTRDIPIIVISGYATPENIDRLKEFGVETVLSKPLDFGLFRKTVQPYISTKD